VSSQERGHFLGDQTVHVISGFLHVRGNPHPNRQAGERRLRRFQNEHPISGNPSHLLQRPVRFIQVMQAIVHRHHVEASILVWEILGIGYEKSGGKPVT
jgi:hypothetical protein